MDLIRLKDDAIKAAIAAGKTIRENMSKEVLVKTKTGLTSYAAQVVTEVDLACEKIILEYLKTSSETYNLAILSEETIDNGSRFEQDYFWCIDPMDGTLAFINKYPGFAVSIALVANDGTPYIGVVYDPSRDILYDAIKDHGAFKNNMPWKITNKNKHLTYVSDKKLSDTPHEDKIKDILKNHMNTLNLDGMKEINGAGAVLNGIRVLENGPACMIKLPKKEKGGGSLWDYAAIACIFTELGLQATNFTGGKLDLNKEEDSFMNHEGVFFGNINPASTD